MTPLVVKVGGSLFDWPELRPRLREWLDRLDRPTLLVPGGGALADVIREYDHVHRLGVEVAHQLAIGTMTLNAEFLGRLLNLNVTDVPNPARPAVVLRRFAIDLPARWSVTSDSIAAAIARSCAADLVLLKSTDPPGDGFPAGYVDEYFPIASDGLHVRAVNLRASAS